MRIRLIRSLKDRLLISFVPLAILSMVVISYYAYNLAQSRITEDRTVLYLKEIAQGVAENIFRTLWEEAEDTIAMSLTTEFRDYLLNPDSEEARSRALEKLNQQVVAHEVYDVLILFDLEDGRIQLVSSLRRGKEGRFLPDQAAQRLQGRRLDELVPGQWLNSIRNGQFAFIDWHSSTLVESLYGYKRRGEDIATQYDIGFASPIGGERIVGGILGLMNWRFIQDILDGVEERMIEKNWQSGYAFLFGRDRNTIIGHKYRLNRYINDPTSGLEIQSQSNNYGVRLAEDLNLGDLRQAVVSGQSSFEYEYPVGSVKISGLAPVFTSLRFPDPNWEDPAGPNNWVCGVGIDNAEIFAPVYDLRGALIIFVLAFGGLVLGVVYFVARWISVPVRELTEGAARIEGGNLYERVEVGSGDEIGELAQTFNRMAASLEQRRKELVELNKSLEEKVRERTQALEERNVEVRTAYRELQETQVQLVQSEKMASLGQLVAGIAHEIKNPLNFIYGNTDFLKQYVQEFKKLASFLERLAPTEVLGKIEDYKKEINFEFVNEDLAVLIRNFEEGAERIHAIIGDLRTFSRLDTDQLRSVDLREPIDLALNLLRNQYRDRVRVHTEYGDLPLVECDPGKISQVMMNLLVNACHAIEGDGDIWIRTSAKDFKVIVEVEDNGSGISVEHLDKVFEPFFTTKAVGKGTGLGLSISYGIVKQHNGTIRVRSDPGKGTTFKIELPLRS